MRIRSVVTTVLASVLAMGTPAPAFGAASDSTDARSKPPSVASTPQPPAPEPAPARVAKRPRPAAKPAAPAPRPTRYDAHSKSVANPDGTTTATVFTAPAYRRSGDTWLPVEPRLHAAADADYPHAISDGVAPVRLGGPGRKLMQIGLSSGAVTLSTGSFELRAATQRGQRLEYATSARDTDLLVEPLATGVRTSQVLRSAQAPTRFRYHLSDPAGVLGTLVHDPDGGYRFTGTSTDGGLRIEPPFAYELKHGATTGDIAGSAGHRVVASGDGYDIEEWVEPEWLARHQFPIVLDPQITLSGTTGNTDCHIVNGGGAGNTYCGGTLTEIGYGGSGFGNVIRRALYQFPYDSIPVGSTVTAATLSLDFASGTAGTASSATAAVHRIAEGQDWASPTWNDRKTATPWTRAGGTAVTPSIDTTSVAAATTAGTAVTWDVTSLVTTQFATTPDGPNPGLVLKVANETPTVILRFKTSEDATAANRPQLTVTYTTPTAPVVTASGGDASARVSWTPGTDNGSRTGFRVRAYRASDGVEVGTPTTAGPGDTSATFPNLSNRTSYFFRVNATYGGGAAGPVGSSGTVTTYAAPLVTAQLTGATGRSTAFGTVYAAGDQLTLTLDITSRDTAAAPHRVVVALPSTSANGPVKLDDGACPSTVSCTVAPAAGAGARDQLTITGLTLDPAEHVTVALDLVPDAPERNCLMASILRTGAAVTNVSDGTASVSTGLPPADLSINVCDAALGLEHWWSYTRTPLGQGTASVNVSSGNLVVQQDDTTPVQAHGDLALLTRRTYNSQDSLLRTLPGSIGAGWSLNVGDMGPASDAGLTPNALVVPPLAAAAQAPLGITLVDRDGTRHRFNPSRTQIAQPIAATGATSLLAPVTGTVPTGQSLCLDVAYKAPPGVELSVWRYVLSSGTTCAATNTFTVAGYVAQRPDRLRTEFDATGRLTAMVDGAGNGIDYTYLGTRLVTVSERVRTAVVPRAIQLTHGVPVTGSPCAGEAWAVTITDPADRVTSYCLDRDPADLTGVAHLQRVENPDGSTIRYRYHGVVASGASAATSCGGEAGQLCAVNNEQDPTHTADTLFAYAAPASGSAITGLPLVASVTNRTGQVTTFAYDFTDAGAGVVDVDTGGHRTRYASIDTYGRAGESQEGTPTGTGGVDVAMLRQTLFAWDTLGTTPVRCRVPHDGLLHHDLCTVTRNALDLAKVFDDDFAGSDEITSFLYNPEASLIRVRKDTNGLAADGILHETYGYHAQYVDDTGGLRCFDDIVAGGGGAVSSSAVACGGTAASTAARDTDTVLVVSDRTQRLTARGNTFTGTAIAPYTTTYTVDSDSATATNKEPAGPICGATAYNTGLVCDVQEPFEGTTLTQTHHTYDQYGQRTATEDARGHFTRYSYFGDGSLDLSSSTGAGGWLQGVFDHLAGTDVTTATKHFVAFAYDAAGNVVRTWDRNATTAANATIATYTSATPPSKAYRETLYAALPGAASSLGSPWRWIASTSDAMATGTPVTREENRTTYTTDYNGNVLSVTPPRGNASTPYDGTGVGNATSIHTTNRSYDAMDRMVEEKLPAAEPSTVRPTTTIGYDAFGNVAYTKDPLGHVTSYVYDAVNRRTQAYVERHSSDDVTIRQKSTGCMAASTVTPTPAGMTGDTNGAVVCRSDISYFDGRDRVYMTTRPTGLHTFHEIDGAGRTTTTVEERVAPHPTMGGGVWLRSLFVYDADGNTLRACTPRHTSESTGLCTSQPTYGVQYGYNTRGDRTSVLRRHTDAVPFTATWDYDENGNVETTTTTGTGRTLTVDYDELDRPVCEHVRRDVAEPDALKTYEYDASGNVVRATRLGAAACPSPTVPSPAGRATTWTYDQNGRLVDTTDAAGGADTAAGGGEVRTRVAYDPDGNVVVEYAPRAFTAGDPPADSVHATRYAYDELGRVKTVFRARTDPGGAPPTLTDTAGNTINDQSTQCPSDVAGYPATAQVCSTRSEYDLAGRLTRVWLPTAGGTTTGDRRIDYGYTSDGLERTVTTPSPTGTGTATTTSYYDAEDQLVAVVDPAGLETAYTYTGDHLLSTVTEPGNGTVTHTESRTYDHNGNMLTQTGFDGVKTTFGYYNDDRLETVSTPNDKAATSTTTAYDPAGNERTYTYNSDGEITGVVSPNANAAGTAYQDSGATARVGTVNEYTPGGLLKTTIVPVSADGVSKLRRTRYFYDVAGRKTKDETDYVYKDTTATFTTYVAFAPAVSDVQTYTYYDNDRLKTRTGDDGTSTITYTYDRDGNTTSAATGTAADTVAAAYYPDGNVLSVDAGSRRTAYLYDGGGSVVARAHAELGSTGAVTGSWSATRYTYGSAGQMTAMRAPVGVVTGGSGNGPAGLTSVTYDILGRVNELTAPNNTFTKTTYASDGTLTSLKTTASSSSTSPLAHWEYTYDNGYRVKTAKYSGNDSTGAVASTTSTYAYTRAGHVASFQMGTGSTEYYEWDHNGNRTCAGTSCGHSTVASGSSKSVFTFNADDSVAKQTVGTGAARTYAYERPFGGTTSDGCNTYTYDVFNRRTMSAQTVTGGTCASTAGPTVTTAYDALGRVRSTTAGTTTNALGYDGLTSNMWRESSTTGAATTLTEYALDPVGDAVALRTGTAAPQFLGRDGGGSTTNVFSSGGAVACATRYDAFGTPRGVAGGTTSSCTGTVTENSFYYRGERRDDDTGEYRLGSRTYDPSKAAFLEPDSADGPSAAQSLAIQADPLTANRYSYVNGDPVNLSDPSGHFSVGGGPSSDRGLHEFCMESADIQLMSFDQCMYDSPIAEDPEAQTVGLGYAPGSSTENLLIIVRTGAGLVPILGDVLDAYDCMAGLRRRDFGVDTQLACVSAVPVAGAGANLLRGAKQLERIQDTMRMGDEAVGTGKKAAKSGGGGTGKTVTKPPKKTPPKATKKTSAKAPGKARTAVKAIKAKKKAANSRHYRKVQASSKYDYIRDRHLRKFESIPDPNGGDDFINRIELHHAHIPQRVWWIPKRILNSSWNLKPLSSLDHAMVDPYRYRRLPKWVKDDFDNYIRKQGEEVKIR